MPSVTVGELLSILRADDFELVGGGLRALSRVVGHRTVQRVGLALSGHTEHVVHDRIQLMGRSEAGFLDKLAPGPRQAHLASLVALDFPALVVTAGRPPEPTLIELCDQAGCGLLCTGLESTEATERVNAALAQFFAPHETRHAVLVDVHGVGVLLTGKSGIGKSEVGLELVARGHRLVADDLVVLRALDEDHVEGTSPELTRHLMEIRGLGIINIKDLFGVAAVREQKRVELVAELVDWNDSIDYDRLGLDERHVALAGVSVPHVTLPVRPGRSLALVIEIAARNRLLKVQGTHSARAFAERLERHIGGGDDDPNASGNGT
ncbi:MAG: HPr(Ser) kinase/phosphatase [Myxococcales bacterium]|nr:HPr(Ser) kinase/phosphatase [Myxococcales bacterium]